MRSINWQVNFKSFKITILRKILIGVITWFILCPVVINAATFVDSTQANFNTGTFFRTQWSAGGNSWVQLTSAGRTALSGTYTSGVKDAGYNASWNSIAWTPSSPYGKELPANLGIETGYNSGNINMNGNVAYFRMNETVGATNLADSSGNGYATTCVSPNCPTLGATGKLNGASTFNGTSSFTTLAPTVISTLQSTASLAFWVKTTQVGNATFWQAPTVAGVEQSGAGNDIFWGNLDNNGKIALVVGDSGAAKSTTTVNDGNWHNVVMTRNATSGDARIYIDGNLESSGGLDTGDKTTPFTGLGRLESSIGSSGYVYFAGSLDEVAVFNRVLTATEITNIYRRGVLRILYQVRSCSTTTCTGVNFEGPDGTTSTYFSELNNNTVNLPSFNLSTLNAPLNRYFQYFATFQTDNNTITPTLKNVIIDYSQYIPAIALNIRNSGDTADINSCDLGTVSIDSVSSCNYRIKVSTNAVNGYVVYMKASGDLSSSSNSIINSAPGSGGSGGSNITAGTENYGAQILANSITGGTISVNPLFNAGGANSVLYNYTTNTNILTATGGNNPTSTAQSSLITHNLAVNGGTAAGYYTQSITYGVIPSF